MTEIKEKIVLGGFPQKIHVKTDDETKPVLLFLHGGHGWLINQFLSPLFNHRTDEYSGTLENRCRLAIEVLKSVREAVGPSFPIEFRMSGAEFCEGGYGIDEGVRIAQMVEPYCDIIHVSAGTYQKTFGITHPSMSEEHGRNVFLAAEVKKCVSKPVATIGGTARPGTGRSRDYKLRQGKMQRLCRLRQVP